MKKWRERFTIALILTAIPLSWSLFVTLPAFSEVYRDLENGVTDWRFRVRGQLEAPGVKLIYANIDGEALQLFGEQPWPRHNFATFAEKLFQHTGTRAVGIDLVFSRVGYSELVDRARATRSDLELARVMREHPDLILAGNYSLTTALPLTLAERQITGSNRPYGQPRALPYRYLGIDPASTFPEVPAFPIVTLDQLLEGRVGLIDWNADRSGNTPRWVPLFAEARGPLAFLDQLDSHLRTFDIPLDHFGEPTEAQADDYFQQGFYLEDQGQIVFFRPEGPADPLPIVEVDHRFYHLSVEIVLRHLGLTREAITLTDEALIITDPDGTVRVRAPLRWGQEMEVNWFSAWYDRDAGLLLENRYNPQDSLTRIRQALINVESGTGAEAGAAREYLARFDNAIVLIGPTDQLLQDLAPTPFDRQPVPKVGLHGNAIKTLLTGTYIRRFPEAQEATFTVLLTFLLTSLVAGLGIYDGRGNHFTKPLSFLVFTGYVALVFIAFKEWHFVLPLVAPAGSAVMAAGFGFLTQLSNEQRRRDRMKEVFGSYLAPEQVKLLVERGEEPKLGGEEVEITAFFSDVQGFSAFSEALTPTQLVSLMNEYLGAMTELLYAEQCSLDKYIGDAIVAFFNAPVPLPNHAANACRAAARIQLRQAELREKWAREGSRWPWMVSEMRTRIGLNSGRATVGDMGSTHRRAYTMMGDTVNLAARCESGAKSIGVQTLITRATRDLAVKSTDDLVFRYLDRWRVAGRQQPVEMFELVGFRRDLTPAMLTALETYEAALQHYFDRDFTRALQFFTEAQHHEPLQPQRDPGIKDNPSLIMQERCRHYLVSPPAEDWEGVFTMLTK